MLVQILAKRRGYTCTVLFSLDPQSGEIDPNQQANIPGLQSLEHADLMVIFTRFRELPPEQMHYIDDYLMAGKPVIGLRTATHAFHNSRNKEDRSEEHTSELQSLMRISYAVFCLKKKKNKNVTTNHQKQHPIIQ